MGNFYNTPGQTGRDLFNSNQQAKKQEDLVLELFQQTPYGMTPFEVLHKLEDMGYRYPITSIRRAITNLTKGNKLIKTDRLKQEAYGKPNYYWKLKENDWNGL